MLELFVFKYLIAVKNSGKIFSGAKIRSLIGIYLTGVR